MIQRIKQHFFEVDPIWHFRQLMYQVVILELFGMWMYVYIQPLFAYYLLLVPLLQIVPANLFYAFHDKFKAKLLAFFVFSASLLIIVSVRDWGIVVAPVIFFFAFLVFLVAYFGPAYRSIACLSMLITFPCLFHPVDWYGAVNIIISSTLLFLFSFILDYVFIFWQRNTIQLCYRAIAKLFIERLNLCLDALDQNCHINLKKQQSILLREIALRTLVIKLVKMPEKNPTNFDHNQIFAALIRTRQSIYSVMEATNFLYANREEIEIYSNQIKKLLNSTKIWFDLLDEKTLSHQNEINYPIVAEPPLDLLAIASKNYLLDLKDLYIKQKDYYVQ